ncbi:DUF4097 family beta strand repeat-containing protein [Sporosalibacterium faouarense]|uniref:DUF4097 family beta strand repeat-containing protein n=1 Tax=Sporosalibacterium faouarense TaxID=516123 RepID=UPI00192CC29D|nr:hypothetical protein [Sporosalibacterium faouarense]
MKRRKIGIITLAITLIALGGFLLANNFLELNSRLISSLLWPSIIIIFGLEIIISKIIFDRKDQDVKASIDGISVVLLIIVIVITSVVSTVSFSITPFRFNLSNIFNGRNPFYSHSSTYSKDYEIILNNRDKITIDNIYGNVKIEKTKGDKIKVLAEISMDYNDQEYADEISEKLIEISEREDRIDIESMVETYNGNNTIGNIRVSLFIQTPPDVEVEVENGYGDVSIEEINKNVKIENEHGQVELRSINGSVDVTNSYDRVEVEKVTQDVKIINKHGEVNIKKVDGNILVRNSYDAINIEEVKGDLEIENSHDKIYVDNIDGNVEIVSQYGDVEVKDANKEIDIRNRHGKILVRAEDIIEGDIDIVNEFGDIDIDLLEDQEGKISAYTKHGEIYTDFDLEINEDVTENSLDGKLGESEVEIQIETKNGNIEINIR